MRDGILVYPAMEIRGLTYGILVTVVFAAVLGRGWAQDDFSGPIKCYFCLGPAENGTCSDPVNPRKDRDNNLEVITCEHGICLKWTYYWEDVLYMHRTCSQRLDAFRIMMIDGVCRSETSGNGMLCMCGKHLCNTAVRLNLSYKMLALCILLVTFSIKGGYYLVGG